MKKFFLYITLFFSLLVCAQNEQLAQHYFDKGDFEKALISYQELVKSQPNNWVFLQKTVECYQQLKQFDKAENAIQEQLNKYRQASSLVELGYNFQLQKDDAKANKYYEQALDRIKKNTSEVYGVAAAFEKKVLVDLALQAYEMANAIDPKFNFNFQIAILYGQKGNTDKMIEKFLEESFTNKQNLYIIQNQLSRFLSEDNNLAFNESLRKALILQSQKSQDIFWNQFLSWFYVQQKEYGKAFVQEKAIYKRNPETFSNIVNLGKMAIDEDIQDAASEILTFVLENTQDMNLQIQARFYLMEMKINSGLEATFPAIETELDQLIKQYGIGPNTLELQILQAHFLTFKRNNPEAGKTILKKALELPLNPYQAADAKMELADIFLFEEKFNQALLYYSQIEEDIKNDVIGHEASLKAAKTSYFKADFVWAQKQFKELKSASTQLIANDALEYFLLINDNTAADSTLTALKDFSRADYLLYQNKNQEALTQFQKILTNYKGNEIESITCYRLGKTFEKLGDYQSALSQYKTIIDQHEDGIYIDEALYFSAEIYNKKLIDVEKAKALYEQIVFHHEDSIYFIDSRKKFRQLRGDTNL